MALEGYVPEALYTQLSRFIGKAYKEDVVYPKQDDIFRALDLCDIANVRVVILGQDPYHGEDQATGLAFSVSEKTRMPPSLRNIFTELEGDIGKTQKHGDLTSWAKQGVLLLNTTLTVKEGAPGSHQGEGWEELTDAILKMLSDTQKGIVFILWGAHARKKREFVDTSKHCVLEAPHPSPLSAHTGFFDSKPFSKANAYLTSQGKKPVTWV